MKLDFPDAKKQVEEIIKIVEQCPESLKETCFRLLFDLAFAEVRSSTETSRNPMAKAISSPPVDDGKERQTQATDFKLPSNMLAFTRKYEIPIEVLQKLFILDHEPLLPIYKITTKVTATAQLHKVMMILLENGLLNNQLKAPYAELRETINEAGLMDGNFNKVLKRNSNLFRGAVTKDKIVETETIELTGEGYEYLSKIIKELVQPAP